MPIRREVVRLLLHVVSAAALAAAYDLPACGQRPAWFDETFQYRRTIDVPSRAKGAEIIVTEFYSHGQWDQNTANPAVYGRGRDALAPYRILQFGPGDFRRMAIQAIDGQAVYHIYYGGKPDKPRPQPEWTATDGLLLETRQWKSCNLFRLESVREAFEQSAPIGADYVGQVFHRHNPFAVAPAPFLSRYHGVLRAPKAGNYTFYTSSQDCSFLSIDGRQVAAAPGAHGAIGRGRYRGTVNLRQGPHSFEYLHAASSTAACMSAAWHVPGEKNLETIPPAAFGSANVTHLRAVPLEHQTERLSPDFQPAAVGDVPLEAGGAPLVRVRFANVSHEAIVKRARIRWDFGDGQSSQESSPTHVYLHPGAYQVTLSMRLGDAHREISNRVEIGTPTVFPGKEGKLDTLADYMPILDTYDSRRLDAAALLQLVRAYLESQKLTEAVQAGKLALAPGASALDDDARWQLALLLGPVLRDQLDDPQGAFDLWRAAGGSIAKSSWRARCAVEAAEVALDDLMQPDEAEPLLRFAAASLKGATGETASRLHRLRGDWLAHKGEASEARSAYAQAEAVRGLARDAVQRHAWRGAYSRSADFFLRAGDLHRARDELRSWQLDYPADKSEGYLSLLWARYWVAKKSPQNAIRVANDLLAVSPDSPYADQLLFLAASCEEKAERPDRAAAAYRSLLTDYPGSPLVGAASQHLKRLSGERLETASPRSSPPKDQE